MNPQQSQLDRGNGDDAPNSFSEDAIVQAICEPARRRMLLALLRSNGMGSTQLAAFSSRPSDSTRKHLAVLRDAGMIVSARDTETDGRRHLYQLSPRVRALANAERGELDLGFCLIRLSL
jgi:DNA-binding transcriptional ArsR family regulator